MKALVTGCAGFVGSTVVDRLLKDGHDVVGFDNFSTGREAFLAGANASKSFELVRGDVLDAAAIEAAAAGCDTVFHMAANADVRFGTDHPTRDFEQNARGTLNVLEAMRKAGVERIAFASTGSIYGDAEVIPTPEDAPTPIQTSLYGASKMAAEQVIEAYSNGFGMRVFIFRFVSLLGERYTHGHVIDFFRQLAAHPESLHILGDGNQKKSYLYVGDCVEAMMHVMATSKDRVNVYNLGSAEYCRTIDSAGWIAAEMGVEPHFTFGGGNNGWIGDNPFLFLDTKKILSTGWKPTLTIREAVEATVRHLRETASSTP